MDMSQTYVPLSKEFFQATTLQVAQRLLGVLLIRRTEEGLLIGRICEVEAYTQEDPASHSYRGLTPRNRWMFGPPGRAYVYRIYGMHHCFNVVTGAEGQGEAVLVRAVEPICGQEQMMRRRRLTERSAMNPKRNPLLASSVERGEQASHRLLKALCSGPARLCQAFNIDTTLNGVDLTDAQSSLLLATWQAKGRDTAPLIATTRIGITQGCERLWRFMCLNDPFVSCPPKGERKILC